MKLPRNVSGQELLRALSVLGYQFVRQKGSHASLTMQVRGEHHIVIPMHNPIKPGTLNAILKDIAQHHQITREALLERIALA